MTPEFISTAEGQKALCAKAMSDSVCLMLNAKVRSLTGVGWDDAALSKMLSTGSDALKQSLRDDLIKDYNEALKKGTQ